MLNGVVLQILSFLYLFLLIIIVFFRKVFNSFEGIIYKVLLFLTSFVLLFDIASVISYCYKQYEILSLIFSRIFLISVIFWCFFLLAYVVSLVNPTNEGSFFKNLKSSKLLFIGFILTIIICIGLCFIKTEIYYDQAHDLYYQQGLALYVTYIVSLIYIGLMVIYLINHYNKIPFNKKLPIYAFLFFGAITMALQWILPYISLIGCVMSFLMLFIYFTTENPDIKIINQLEKDKEIIEEASSAKTDFLSNMSHDIRTPMNAIIGFSESLLLENLEAKQKEEVENIYAAAKTLLDIINNILDVSRIEAGKEEKKEHEYDFNKLIKSLVNVATAKLDPSKIKFNLNVDKNVPDLLYGDEIKLYQIVMNLLSNAVKYTEKGSIDFNVVATNVGEISKIKFEVKDTGIGIKEKDFGDVFKKFSRIHNKENYNTIEGTGLGLVITKSLTELLGGTINFTSEFGVGSTFTVEIPQKIVKMVNADDAIKQSNQFSERVDANQISFDGSLYDILIVDDNDLNLKVAQRILSDYKFNITLAASGQECIDLLLSGKRFDLIFLDHMMPVMDGIETIHKIKNLENIKIPPIVALTANAMVGMKEMFLSEGFDSYISKPINRNELQSLLKSIFCKVE